MSVYPYRRFNSIWFFQLFAIALMLCWAGFFLFIVLPKYPVVTVLVCLLALFFVLAGCHSCCFPVFYANTLELRHRYCGFLNREVAYGDIDWIEVEFIPGSRGSLYSLSWFLKDGRRIRQNNLSCMPDIMMPAFIKELRSHSVPVVVDKLFADTIPVEDVPFARRKICKNRRRNYMAFLCIHAAFIAVPTLLFGKGLYDFAIIALIIWIIVLILFSPWYSYPVLYEDRLEIEIPLRRNLKVYISDISSVRVEGSFLYIKMKNDVDVRRLRLGRCFDKCRLRELLDYLNERGVKIL